MKKFNVAVVGATGMVGGKFLQVLEERQLPVENYYLFASARSAGKKVMFMGKEHTIIELNSENIKGKDIDFALFSAGAGTSKEFAPQFAEIGTVVVDNSSYWRTHDDIPLVVPEVNPDDVDWNTGIIANPNCSTIQAVVALKPIYDNFGIDRIVYSTYQAVSGAGVGGYMDLENGLKGEAPQKFQYSIAGNCIPQIDVFLENGYTKEEEKMIFETKKILHDQTLKITATTVRVPVFHSHAESINVEMKKSTTREELMQVIATGKNIIVCDDIANNIYPMQLDSTDKDEVFVGRIRMDETVESGMNMWVVADNIRKGAATNAVQIMELLMAKAK
ncbi:MAG: aspartate-semialdehyde dehydrogenase [Bacillota bacterium]